MGPGRSMVSCSSPPGLLLFGKIQGREVRRGGGGGTVLLLNRLEHLVAKDFDISGSLDAQFDLIAFDIHHGYHDALIDNEAFIPAA